MGATREEKDSRMFYISHSNGIIWGIGRTENSARNDARKYCTDNIDFSVCRCTRSLYNHVKKNGYDSAHPDISWGFPKNGTAYIVSRMTDCNV